MFAPRFGDRVCPNVLPLKAKVVVKLFWFKESRVLEQGVAPMLFAPRFGARFRARVFSKVWGTVWGKVFALWEQGMPNAVPPFEQSGCSNVLVQRACSNVDNKGLL